MKTIFFDSSEILNHPSGMSIYSIELLREIVRQNTKYSISTGYVSSRRNLHDKLKDILALNNIDVPIERINLPGRFAGKLPWTKRNYTLTHSPAYLNPNWINAKKSIVTLHDLYYLRYPNSPGNNSPQLDNNFKKSVLLSDCIITDSEFSKTEIIELLKVDPHTIEICYPASQWPVLVETNHITTPPQIHDKPYFLSVGGLCERKNYSLLIDVYKNFRKSHNDVDLIIVGKDQGHTSSVLKLLKETQGVIWKPYCSINELKSLYTNARAFLMPSVYEGFGIPLLEALQHQCPSAFSKGSSMDEIAGIAALGIEPNNKNEWLTAMETLLNDDKKRQHLMQEGLKQAEKFNWKKSASQILKIYDKFFQTS